MKFATIEDNVVIGIIISDSQYDPSWVSIPEEVDIGWTRNPDDSFIAPPAPPAPVTMERRLTHLGFRQRFTQAEQEWADELEATFEINPVFTVEQKRMLRTGYKNFNLATSVDLDDPRIPPMLGLYVMLGGLTPNRPAEILN